MTRSSASAIAITTVSSDGEPRVRDLDLGDRLGFSRPEDIRKIIRRHEKTLKKINVLATVAQTPDPKVGGRPARIYNLCESQAVFIIGKSETEIADDLFAEIAIAFVEYRRRAFDTRLYGAIARDLLLPSPRNWEREFDEGFWINLHRVGGWKRPDGNNHSNCAHFINRYVYEYLLGSLGLAALRDANPRNDDGERMHRHHQLLKDRHLDRLRRHIAVVTGLLANAVSLRHFADQFARAFPDANVHLGLLFIDEPVVTSSQAEASGDRSRGLPA